MIQSDSRISNRSVSQLVGRSVGPSKMAESEGIPVTASPTTEQIPHHIPLPPHRRKVTHACEECRQRRVSISPTKKRRDKLNFSCHQLSPGKMYRYSSLQTLYRQPTRLHLRQRQDADAPRAAPKSFGCSDREKSQATRPGPAELYDIR